MTDCNDIIHSFEVYTRSEQILNFDNSANWSFGCKIDISVKGNVYIYKNSRSIYAIEPYSIIHKIIDDIEIPKDTIDMMGKTLRHFGGICEAHISRRRIIEFISSIKTIEKNNAIEKQNQINQLKTQIEIVEKEKQSLEKQILNYEKIKQMTITKLPYLSKYYSSDIDIIEKEEELLNKNNTELFEKDKEILQQKLNNYRKKYLNLTNELI